MFSLLRSSATTAFVQTNVPKQVRPNSISASPPKIKNIEAADDIKLISDSSKGTKFQKQRVSSEITSVPVLTVLSLPQSNINLSRIVVSQANDTAELPATSASSLVTTNVASADTQNHPDTADVESTKQSEKDASETASDSVRATDLLSPLSNKSASTTPAYEVSMRCATVSLFDRVLMSFVKVFNYTRLNNEAQQHYRLVLILIYSSRFVQL